MFRLHRQARELGIVSSPTLDLIGSWMRDIDGEIGRLRREFNQGASLAQWLKRPDMVYQKLPGANPGLHEEVIRQVDVTLKYEGYISREQERIAKAELIEHELIPGEIDYQAIKALRRESREKLDRIRPENLGQASRISGVNPADIAILSVWLKRLRSTVAAE